MRGAVAFLCLLSVAGHVSAQATTTKDEFIAFVEKQDNCLIAEKDAAALLEPLGFTQDVVRGYVDELLTDGLAVVDETGFKLKTGKCS
ncbi:MAG: hypothetical protein ABIV25_01455 [Paracoccaceae bacterium]